MKLWVINTHLLDSIFRWLAENLLKNFEFFVIDQFVSVGVKHFEGHIKALKDFMNSKLSTTWLFSSYSYSCLTKIILTAIKSLNISLFFWKKNFQLIKVCTCFGFVMMHKRNRYSLYDIMPSLPNFLKNWVSPVFISPCFGVHFRSLSSISAAEYEIR